MRGGLLALVLGQIILEPQDLLALDVLQVQAEQDLGGLLLGGIVPQVLGVQDQADRDPRVQVVQDQRALVQGQLELEERELGGLAQDLECVQVFVLVSDNVLQVLTRDLR